MKQLLLATALIAVPVAVFSGVEHYMLPQSPVAATAQPSLGDMSLFQAIVADTQAIAASGDLVAAERRITDLETAWDDAAKEMRAKAPLAWGNVDAAADAAFSALRAKAPDPAKVEVALAELTATLANPDGAASSGPVEQVSGIAVTDAGGHPIACEVMLGDLRNGIVAGRVPTGAEAQVSDLQSKATERCNADDDRRADAFSAQALALLTPKGTTK